MNQKSDERATDDVDPDTQDGNGASADRASDDDALFDTDDIVAEEPASPARLPLILAGSALLVALLALIGVILELREPAPTSGTDVTNAIPALEDRLANNEAALDRLAESVEPVEQSLATVEERLSRLAADRSAVDADVASLQRRVDQQLDALESLPSRIASVERSVSTLRGMSTGAREAWLLAQAEYFLQVANAELELARNPSIAKTALEMADERLLTIGDPGLTDVRRALSAELRALEALDMPDVSGTAVTLAGLSRVVDSLPLRRQLVTKRPEDGEVDGEPGAEPAGASGTERALATLKNAFSGIVSVRRSDEEIEPLIAPESVYFLRANLSLQLQAARLALLRGEQALFDQSLDDVETWLREFYDTDSTPVRSALETVAEVRDAAITGELPDISESLRLLRSYIAFTDAGTNGGTADGGAGDEPPQ